MPSFKPVTHVIFDVDGLLLDSESLYTKATELVSAEYGKTYPWELKVAQMGCASLTCAEIIVKGLELPLTVQEYRGKVTEHYQDLFPKCQLLPDTERLYTVATQTIASKFGKLYSWELKVKCMGLKGTLAIEKIINELELPITVDEYVESINKEYSKLFPASQLLPGAEKLVQHLYRNNIPVAIASGSAEENFILKTKQHGDLFNLFSHRVLASSDPEVKNGKPAPDIFLICAKRFSTNPMPSECLVFEDAPNGVRAALAANMQVIMVPDTRMDPLLTKDATLVLNSLEEFKPELFALPSY